MNPTRVGVVGVGYLGRFHAQKYADSEHAELAGVCDLDATRGQAVAEEVGCAYVPDCHDLVDSVEAVSR